MDKRIEYIDNIKGFAILLVVMGHQIACWFDDYESILSDSTSNDMLMWKLIYSFHMPLFMFCSGLFQLVATHDTSIHDYGKMLGRRFKTLMIPYFFSGTLLWFLTGSMSSYWYLLFLFIFIAINGLISVLIALIPPPQEFHNQLK